MKPYKNIFGGIAQDMLSTIVESIQSGEMSIVAEPDIRHEHKTHHGHVSDHVSGSLMIRITFSAKEKRTQEK